MRGSALRPRCPMFYGLLADVVVACHVAYVSFVVVGQLLILVGLARRWRWVRDPWFRVAHLGAILVVAAESLLGLTCPLTHWEEALRAAAGQEGIGGDFLGHYLHALIFFPLPPAVFLALYLGFAALVAATFALAPPRWRGYNEPGPTPTRAAGGAR